MPHLIKDPMRSAARPRLVPRLWGYLILFALAGLAIMVFSAVPFAQGATRIWDGGGADNNWSTCANWSANVCPVAGDAVTFDGTSSKSAAIDTSVTVAGLTVTSAYSGILSQSSGASLTVNGAYAQSGGTFAGGDSTIDINSAFILSGGAFTSTTGELQLDIAVTVSGSPTFDANGGTVSFDGRAGTISPGSLQFNDVKFPSAVTKTVGNSQTLTVNGTLTLGDGAVAQTTVPNNGTIAAKGNVTQEAAFDGTTGPGTIVFSGAGNQTFIGNATSTAGLLARVQVNKPSGTLFLAGTIRTASNWTQTAGAVDSSTHNSHLISVGPQTFTGGPIFHNLYVTGTGSRIIGNDSTLTVTGTLTLDDGSIAQTSVPATGTIDARGDIVQNAAFDGGSGTLTISGPGSQTFTGNATVSAGLLTKVDIRKPSGTLTLSGTIRATSDWTYTQGFVDASTYESTVSFGNSLTITGSHTLHHVVFDPNTTSARTYAVASGTTLTARGTLTIDNSSSGTITINTGTLAAQGGLAFPDVIAYGGSSTLLINGSADQSMTGGHSRTLGNLPSLVINKPSGTLTLLGTLRTSNSWTYTAGNVDASTNGSTVVFVKAGMQTISGSHTLHHVVFDPNTAATRTYDITSGTTLTARGTLTIDNSSSGTITIDTGTLAARGDILFSDALNHGGTATILIDGNADQTLSSSHTTTAGGIPSLTIDKPSGTLFLAGTIRTASNWTHVQGLMDATTYDSTVVFANASLSISGSQALNNVTFNQNSASARTYTLASGTTLTVLGTLRIANEGAGLATISGGTLEAKGDLFLNSSSSASANTSLLVSGAGDQRLTGAHSTTSGTLPNLTIDKPSGTLHLAGTIRTTGGWDYRAGTLNPGTSKIVFATGTGRLLRGSHGLHDVEFDRAGGGATIEAGTVLTVNGSLALTEGAIDGGTVKALGHVTHTARFNGGSATLEISGNTARSITFSDSGAVPNLLIDAPYTGVSAPLTGRIAVGDLTIQSGHFHANGSVIALQGNLDYQGGSFDAGTGTLVMVGAAGGTILPPSSLNNLTLNDGLVGYWKLDALSGGMAMDSSPLGNSGVVLNTVSQSPSAPVFAFDNPRSADFNGTGGNAMVMLPDNATLKPQFPLSVSLWVKPRTLGATQSLFSNDNFGGNTYAGVTVRLEAAATIGAYIGNGGGAGPGNRRQKGGTVSLVAGEWHHVVVVFRNINDSSIYINGVEDVGGVYDGDATTLAYTSTQGRIGRGGDGFWQFDGLMDDVRLYNRSLSGAEVVALAEGVERPTSGIVHILRGAVALAGNLNISGSTLDASSQDISVAGNLISNEGFLLPGDSTVTLNGTGQSLQGSFDFHNLQKTVSSADILIFAAESIVSVAGDLTLQGSPGQTLSLRSSNSGTKWDLSVAGRFTPEYLDVQDSNNTGLELILANSITNTDSGNNSRWSFDSSLAPPTPRPTPIPPPIPTLRPIPTASPIPSGFQTTTPVVSPMPSSSQTNSTQDPISSGRISSPGTSPKTEPSSSKPTPASISVSPLSTSAPGLAYSDLIINIRGADGKPLVGVVIILKMTGERAVSGLDGRVTFTHKNPGTYTVFYCFQGWSGEMVVTVSAGNGKTVHTARLELVADQDEEMGSWSFGPAMILLTAAYLAWQRISQIAARM